MSRASLPHSMFVSRAARFGGLTPLLAKFPDIFELSNDPPFNHITIASSFNAADADLVNDSHFHAFTDLRLIT